MDVSFYKSFDRHYGISHRKAISDSSRRMINKNFRTIKYYIIMETNVKIPQAKRTVKTTEKSQAPATKNNYNELFFSSIVEKLENVRSEERRVGKECRSRCTRYH